MNLRSQGSRIVQAAVIATGIMFIGSGCWAQSPATATRAPGQFRETTKNPPQSGGGEKVRPGQSAESNKKPLHTSAGEPKFRPGDSGESNKKPLHTSAGEPKVRPGESAESNKKPLHTSAGEPKSRPGEFGEANKKPLHSSAGEPKMSAGQIRSTLPDKSGAAPKAGAGAPSPGKRI
jgi:hypothetical protein